MAVTSGTQLLDTLIDDVQVGDNLVLLAGGGASLDVLVERFLAAAVPSTAVVVALRPGGPLLSVPGARILDWSAPHGDAPQAASRRDALPPDATLGDALEMLARVDEQVGVGAVFVFDELTWLPDAWGADAALELFLAACPRLYRRRSLALWSVRAERHPPSFVRRLTEVTQVVVEVEGTDADLTLTVRKADGRDESAVGRRVRAEVVDGDLRATETPGSVRERLGTLIRDRRLSAGMAQVEVARRVGISPSALSQIERGVRGPSGDTLMRLWEVLGVPFGPTESDDLGYRIARRSGRARTRLQEGLDAERLIDDPDGGEVWALEIAPGAHGARAPFAVKSAETVVVLVGVLDLQLSRREETLHEGDVVVVARAAVTGWANPGPQPAKVLWTVHART